MFSVKLQTATTVQERQQRVTDLIHLLSRETRQLCRVFRFKHRCQCRMSLSALNAPPLIATLSLGSYVLFPALRTTFENKAISWTIVKTTNLCAYGLSVWSVSQPGRYDGQTIQDTNASPGVAATEMEQMSPGRNGRTLVPPAGFAFAIWGPIFLGELVMVGAQWTTLSESSPIAPLIREITGPFLAAQIFQTLWTASFRPKYNNNGLLYYKYVSAVNLSGIAYALSFCHQPYTRSDVVPNYTFGEYCLYFLPLSLHFGWTTAAAVVNWNGMFALSENVSSRSVAWLGHISVVGATTIGVTLTLTRSAPVYAGVIAWALFAVASGLSQRIRETEKEDRNRVGVYGAALQRTLSLAGAAVNAVAAGFVALL